jgi:DNA-binding IclR family transcriptional regulator
MEVWYQRCLQRWTAANKRTPTLDEIAAYCGKSRSAAYSALVALEHKGQLARDQDRRFVVVIPVEDVQ